MRKMSLAFSNYCLLIYFAAGGGKFINLEPFQLELAAQVYERKQHKNLLQWLQEVHSVQVSFCTLKTRLKEWAVSKHMSKDKEERVKRIIQVLFFQGRLEDKEMLVGLARQDFTVGSYTLVRLWFELDIKRGSEIQRS
jgi:uncharacterized protein YigA (DUF484 family)